MQALTNMIHLYDKYYLSADSVQFIVSEKKICKTGENIGKEKFANNKYFPKLSLLFEYLLEGLLKNKLGEKTPQTLQGIKENQEQFIEDLKEVSERVGSIRHLLEEIKE